MRLTKVFNLRVDSDWVQLVRVQAKDAGRNPGRYVRDLVWLLSSDPELNSEVIQGLQGVYYGQI